MQSQAGESEGKREERLGKIQCDNIAAVLAMPPQRLEDMAAGDYALGIFLSKCCKEEPHLGVVHRQSKEGDFACAFWLKARFSPLEGHCIWSESSGVT